MSSYYAGVECVEVLLIRPVHLKEFANSSQVERYITAFLSCAGEVQNTMVIQNKRKSRKSFDIFEIYSDFYLSRNLKIEWEGGR